MAKVIQGIMLTALLLAAATLAGAASLWSETTTPATMDTTARKVGDLLTVEILQESIATTSAQHNTMKDAKLDVGAGTGLLHAFAGLGAKGGSSSAGAGSSTASTRIVDRLTVSIVEVLPEGNLRVEGKRVIALEKDKTEITFTGTVRPQDVRPDNTIPSNLVADQQLTTRGMGPIAEKRKPGLLSRLLSFLF